MKSMVYFVKLNAISLLSLKYSVNLNNIFLTDQETAEVKKFDDVLFNNVLVVKNLDTFRSLKLNKSDELEWRMRSLK